MTLWQLSLMLIGIATVLNSITLILLVRMVRRLAGDVAIYRSSQLIERGINKVIFR